MCGTLPFVDDCGLFMCWLDVADSVVCVVRDSLHSGSKARRFVVDEVNRAREIRDGRFISVVGCRR